MLTTALEVVRDLADKAIAAGEHHHATTLSRLSSTLESAVRSEEITHRSYVARDEIDALATKMIADYCELSKGVLSDADYATFESCLKSALPKPRNLDPSVARLRVECEQVRMLFDMAVTNKSVGDCNRLGNLLCQKVKALRRAEIDAGVLITKEQLTPLQEPLIAAGAMARDAIGPTAYDPLVDLLKAGYGDRE